MELTAVVCGPCAHTWSDVRQKRTPSALLLRSLGPGLLFVRPRWTGSLFGDGTALAPEGLPPPDTLAFEIAPGTTYLVDPGRPPHKLPTTVLLECFSPQRAPATLVWTPDVTPEMVANARFAFLGPDLAQAPPALAYENGQNEQIRRRFTLSSSEVAGLQPP